MERTVAVIGPNTKTAQIMGGGSAQLNPHCAISPFDGIAAKAVAVPWRSQAKASQPRPVKELKGFVKLTLAPGKTRQVKVAPDARAFAWFDASEDQWRIDAGTFEISAGFSAADLRATVSVTQTVRLLPV